MNSPTPTKDDPKELAAELVAQARAAQESGQMNRAILHFDCALILHRATDLGWDALIDLVSQGELFLELNGQLIPGLCCLHQASELARHLEAPQAGEISLRFESIMGQFADRFPDKAEQLEAQFKEDPDQLRVEGVHELLDHPALAVLYFDEQRRVAASLDAPGGVFSSLGSQAQSLADLGHNEGAAAALILAEEAAEGLPVEAGSSVRAALDSWHRGLAEVMGSDRLRELGSSLRGRAEEARAQAVTAVLSSQGS